MRTIKVGFCFLQVVFLLTIWLSNVHVVVPRSHKVKYLPGFDGPLPFSLETGYIGVDQGEEAQLFYYFFESENNPKEDPLLVWLTGGPLCSAMSAILYEIGPIQFEEKNDNQALPKLVLRSHSWTKLASIIFVDFPTGAGFSYAKTPRTNYSGDYRASHNMNEFLRKWLTNHPQFLSNHLYLGGDSYTGFTLPLYFVDMVSGNERGLQPFLNLKKEGYIIAQDWMNKRSVQANFHIRKGTIGKWKRCNYAHKYSYEVSSSVPYHLELSAKGFRSLIYSGDHDMIVPFLGTQAWIRSLNYSILDDWRKWMVDGQVAGFTRTYTNKMTFATVKGAGHTAPEYKPKQCASMFKRWIQGEAL
ncbi:hypothetical protein BVRB_1g014840 [Beta vulgaris subsp. vulgaris]|nr:hypothetical protein BVRB_1g014840 [Beta vulgaris subsp. vulgaris]